MNDEVYQNNLQHLIMLMFYRFVLHKAVSCNKIGALSVWWAKTVSIKLRAINLDTAYMVWIIVLLWGFIIVPVNDVTNLGRSAALSVRICRAVDLCRHVMHKEVDIETPECGDLLSFSDTGPVPIQDSNPYYTFKRDI